MKASDIKKGMKIQDVHGEYGVMMDNKRTSMRLIEHHNEQFNRKYLGEMHVSKIAKGLNEDSWEEVELSAGQLKQKKAMADFDRMLGGY